MSDSPSGQRIAVVLFNLGGPDTPEAVRPFLFNLFKDEAILRLPAVLRYPLAWLIALSRAPKTKEIYARIGGKSPLVEMTHKQAAALENALRGHDDYKVFTCMRYWHPMSTGVVKAVKEFAPHKIILLPLYPQFSTTTTASSFADWERAAAKEGVDIPTQRICCYPAEPRFIAGHANIIRTAYWEASEEAPPRLLFSAHGLPKKVIEAGDPYQWQVEQTAQAVVSVLAIPELDWRVCYQSRVGPLEWIGPSTETEILRAAEEKKPVLVVPIAFVSEHSETLVELDMDYAQLAKEKGVPKYVRAPALGVEPMFIEALAVLCRETPTYSKACVSAGGMCICPVNFSGCPCGKEAA